MEIKCGHDVLILSTTLLMDRALLYSNFLDRLAEKTREITVLTTTLENSRSRDAWASSPVTVRPFPVVRPYREFPYNYLRRLNDYIWDYQLKIPTRRSMHEHVRKHHLTRTNRLLRGVAKAMSMANAGNNVEKSLEKLLLTYSRSSDAHAYLKSDRPLVTIVTGPHRYGDMAVAGEAKRLGIPVLAFITSWDNLSTKNRLVFNYDAYLVWSEEMKRELREYYPSSRDVPVYVVGAPQFDVFYLKSFEISREDFCRSQGLRADRPIILYALGSPNFIPGEWHGAMHLAERIENRELADAQLLVRPHPLFDDGLLKEQFKKFGDRVIVQKTGDAGLPVASRFQNEDQIREWVNTFRHSDVVVNFSSTVTVDASIFDRPVVNLDFDPEPGRPKQSLVKDVNHVWNHFKPIAESGGIWLVDNLEEMVDAVKAYLERPELHREQRRWIAEYVCGYLDGRSGERMADAVMDFIENVNRTRNMRN